MNDTLIPSKAEQAYLAIAEAVADLSEHLPGTRNAILRGKRISIFAAGPVRATGEWAYVADSHIEGRTKEWWKDPTGDLLLLDSARIDALLWGGIPQADASIPEGEIHFRDSETGEVLQVVKVDDTQDARVSLSEAGEVKNLADGVERVVGFEEALRDPSIGHKVIGEMFPFTSETSVRRWRKNQGVVLA